MLDKISRRGWIPDLPDHRDRPMVHKYALASLPSSVSLESGMPPVYDQGQRGSCTANAISGALDYARKRQGLRFMTPSRLFIYYNERDMEGTIESDSGAMIRDGLKSIASQGACVEAFWPYVETQFATTPGPLCYSTALRHKTLQYLAPDQNTTALKTCLAQGFPFIFGFSVYESFMSDEVAATGVVPMPSSDEGQVGGHAVLACGYTDSKQAFRFRNSWGTSWGDKGYGWIPYAYVSDNSLADDMWVILLEEG